MGNSIKTDFSDKLEQKHTDKNIKKHGYNNVRGGKYTNSNTLIKNKTNEINQNIKLEFKKTKVYLDPAELNLVLKLQNPKVLIINNEIDLSKLDLFVSLKLQIYSLVRL